MSIAFDAKTAAIKAYPKRGQDGVDLLLLICDVSEEDFTYNEGETPSIYLYGKKKK